MAIFWGWPNGGFEPKIKAVVDLAEKRDYGGCDKYPFFRDFINSGFGIGALYVSKAVYSCLWRATTILWRQYVANRFPLFNFINLYQKMSGHSAHFSFDTFRGYSLKGVFLSSFFAWFYFSLTIHIFFLFSKAHRLQPEHILLLVQIILS